MAHVNRLPVQIESTLLFRDLADEIPNIRKLIEGGMHGDLASITPPITVPAWACAMTGKTPGQLGIYGFRNRKDNSYDGLSITTSGSVTVVCRSAAHGRSV